MIERIRDNQTSHIRSEAKKCQNVINRTFDALVESLKKRQKSLQNELEQIINENHNELNQTAEQINQCLTKSRKIKQECHKLLNKPTKIEQLSERRDKIQKKGERILRMRGGIDEPDLAPIVSFKAYLNSLLKIHDKFGEVYKVRSVYSDEWDVESKG